MRSRLLFLPLMAMFMVHGLPTSGQAPKDAAPPTGLAIDFGGPGGRLVTVSGQFTAAKEKAVNGFVVTSTDKAPLVLEDPKKQDGPRELRALIRLRGDLSAAPMASFAVARQDAKDPGLRMQISGRKDGDMISATVTRSGKPLHDLKKLAEKFDWQPEFHNGFTYYPRAYPLSEIRPGWPDDFRARVEQDMSALPNGNDKWVSVRIELRPGKACFWLDDHLIATTEADEPPIAGTTQVTLGPGVQLANFEVAPIEASKGFLPVRLDGYANGRAFLGSSVKTETLPTVIGGVPFVFPTLNAEGKDHLDLSRSFVRQGNMDGYIQSLGHRMVGSARRDPARIQLRIPYGSYDALYVVAAATGEANTIPTLTAMFYRPSAGYPQNFEKDIPLATAETADAVPIPVTLANGKQVKLWMVKIPLDPAKLASFSDMDIIELELTKKVQLYRSYPDPINYGEHQAGLPSSVHVFGLTLDELPWYMEIVPTKFGHVWIAPEVPTYLVNLTNGSAKDLKANITVRACSYDGTEKSVQKKVANVPADNAETVDFKFPVKLNGIHEVTATVEMGGKTWTETRNFCRLAPDTRSAKWTEGKGALFGYWSYHGGHYTPKAEHHIALMTQAGARTSSGISAAQAQHPLVQKHWAPAQSSAWTVRPQPWAREEKYDPEQYAAYQKQVIATLKKERDALPPEMRPDHVYIFPEPHISSKLTEGNFASYWGEPEPPLTEAEKTNLRMFSVTAKCAAEAIRKEFPELKVLLPWGDPLFVPPILRAGFPKDLIDGSGLDVPGFERLPEIQLHQNAIHRLYELKKEYEKFGKPNPQLQFTEGIFVPTEPGSVTYREQMDIYHRWNLISMAYGVTRFHSGWFAFDAGNYYGTEHYGGCGIQRRIPYCDPKPAYAAFATMTDKLNEANFEGWVKTGSLTSYCLRFSKPRPESSKVGDTKIYALWNIRGTRPATLTLQSDGEVHVTDSMNNTKVLKTANKQAMFPLDPSVVYVTTTTPLESIAVGDTDHADVRPAETAKQVADFGDGSWQFTNQPDKIYENGTFAVSRYLGRFSDSIVTDESHGKVLASKLEKQGKVHELMPWYNVLASKKKAAPISGAPSHLGLWVKGASDWGRIVYVLRDAKGERWTSIGFQDQYNCDDPHSWSYFNFDGWRYLRFELPGHAGYDNYRKAGTTWWRGDGGDGIVDLPLTLENVIVEQRSHVLYVNDVRPVASDAVQFGKLFAEYASAEDATPQAVVQSKLRMILPKGAVDLPNPIANLEKEGLGEPTKVLKLDPPIEHNDGTSIHVQFEESKAAAKHFIWVGLRPDGKGAINMTPAGAKSNVLVRGLRPGGPFYFWVTYVDAQGKPSKPSVAERATLVDTFSQK